MRKSKIWVGFAVGLIVGLTISSLAAQPPGSDADKAVEDFFQKFVQPMAWLVSQVQHNYVEDVDMHDMVEGAYQGVLSKLDRYCVYYPPDAFKELQADTRGEFGGLGMEIYFDPIKKVVMVERPMPGTPAFRAGVLGGDMIIEVQQEGSEEVVKTEDFGDVHDALKVLRGKKGSRVTITVLRGDTRQRKQFTIKRAIITIPGIRGARVIEGENRIGYVYVAEFHEKVAGDLEKRIMELVDQNVDGIIIDLRFNRGGLLDAALNVSDLFLDDGIIVSTKGRTSPLRVFRARQSQIAEGMPIVVLANRYSASAAEIVTAALRDNDRARFVGESTFGKASVQTIIEHPDEQSAIKLTTGRYYTPTGDLIEGEGVSPDVEEKLSDEDLLRLMQHLSRELDAGAEEEPEDEGEAAAEPAEPEVEVESPGEAAAAAEPEEPFQDVQLDRALAEMAQMLEGATEEAVPVQAVEAPEPARVN